MLDVRYHIFYLGLMFLMLGFGVFIGASIIGPAQVRQQTNSIANLRLETLKVVQSRDQAQERLGKDEAALSALRPALIHGILAGKRVILIQTGDYAEAAEAAGTALSDAGATIAATVVLTDKWGVLLPRQRAALTPVANDADAAAQDKALLAALASATAFGTRDKASAATLQALQAQGLITVSGEFSQPCTLFVLVGGSRDESTGNAWDGPLLDGFRAVPDGVTAVGCEPFEAASSSIPAYQSAGIATVDCIDLPLGKLALPLALRGDKGDYGLKPTAKQPLPALPTSAAP